MKRTYHYQVDNGLFVLENIIKKPYSEITIQDLFENNKIISAKIQSAIKSEGVDICQALTHFNSILTQTKSKKSIEEVMRELLNNISNHKYCIICGEKQVNTNIEVDRKYIANLVSQTFFNHASNLKHVDICPICVYLSLISVLNNQRIGSAILYNSDSDEAMRYITNQQQLKIDKNQLIDVKIKKTDNYIETCLNIKRIQDMFNSNYLSQHCIANGQNVFYDEKVLNRKDYNLLSDLKSSQLLHEFIELGLFYNLINKSSFTNTLLKYNKNCSKELYELLEDYEMTEKQKEIVNKICIKLLESEDSKELSKQLRCCDNKSKFQDFLLKYQESLNILSNLDEMEEVLNFRKWKDYKTSLQFRITMQ